MPDGVFCFFHPERTLSASLFSTTQNFLSICSIDARGIVHVAKRVGLCLTISPIHTSLLLLLLLDDVQFFDSVLIGDIVEFDVVLHIITINQFL